MRELPVYNCAQSYRWNYEHAPDTLTGRESESLPQSPSCTFLGKPVSSPIGIAAGPLLNGSWLLYYASLGYDVLTYKTVRSRARESYPRPNLQPVSNSSFPPGHTLSAVTSVTGSWAISFGMPSSLPEVWRADLEATKKQLSGDQLLSVSVVASAEPDWSLKQIAEDYALCARWAVESGADCVEVNFSCPNVQSQDGQLYQVPEAAQTVATYVKRVTADVPLIVKLGHVPSAGQAKCLLQAIGSVADGLSMTNCISAQVERQSRLMFDGQSRGIGGHAIRAASVAQVDMFSKLIRELGLPTKIIGVGGVFNAEHASQYLAAGAEAVHLATAVMLDPLVGKKIKQGLYANSSDGA